MSAKSKRQRRPEPQDSSTSSAGWGSKWTISGTPRLSPGSPTGPTHKPRTSKPSWRRSKRHARGQGLRADTDGSGRERPLLDPGQVVLFAHAMSHSTRFERGQIERLGLARVALEEVRSDPEGAASQALQLLANRSDHYAIHLDVDVVDFTDAPLSEHPSRNTGLKLDEMLRALRVLASGPGLVAITLAELNPHNAAAGNRRATLVFRVVLLGG